jgi:hypothetical protein
MNIEVSKYISRVWNDRKWDMQHSAISKIFYFNNEIQQLAVIEKLKRFYRRNKEDTL